MLLGISATDKELDEYLLIADADGSKAIDLQEWIVLCGMLVKPPYEENELLAAFHVRSIHMHSERHIHLHTYTRIYIAASACFQTSRTSP